MAPPRCRNISSSNTWAALRERRVDVAIGHRNDGGDVGGEIAVDARAPGLRASRQSLTAGKRFEIDLDRRRGILGE